MAKGMFGGNSLLFLIGVLAVTSGALLVMQQVVATTEQKMMRQSDQITTDAQTRLIVQRVYINQGLDTLTVTVTASPGAAALRADTLRIRLHSSSDAQYEYDGTPHTPLNGQGTYTLASVKAKDADIQTLLPGELTDIIIPLPLLQSKDTVELLFLPQQGMHTTLHVDIPTRSTRAEQLYP